MVGIHPGRRVGRFSPYTVRQPYLLNDGVKFHDDATETYNGAESLEMLLQNKRSF
jgi:hypothetical protein